MGENGTETDNNQTIVAHKSLAEALAAFQAEAPTLHKTAEANAGSYSYRYVELADIVKEIQSLMLKHGLSFSAFPAIGPDNKPALRYKLRHVGGDSEEDVMSLMVSKVDAQAHGSAITYARRYALTAVLNLVADTDDDGGAAAKAAAAAERAAAAPRLLNDTERDRVLGAIADADQDEGLVFAAVGVSSAEELTVAHALQIRALLDKALEGAAS